MLILTDLHFIFNYLGKEIIPDDKKTADKLQKKLAELVATIK